MNNTSTASNSLIRAFLFALLVLLLASPVLAILEKGEVKIFAVTEDHKGMAADLFMYTIPGSGKSAFITSNSVVGKDTQTTGNIALQIAQKKSGVRLTDKDMIFDIHANATEVDGPSAGAAMTMLAYSMFSEKVLQENIAITGTITNDGSIGMVGGVGVKAEAAAKIGIKLFMIPLGEAVTEVGNGASTQTVNLLEYAPKNLDMKVVEVSNIDQVIEYAYSDIDQIKVDVNSTEQTFIPKPIQYNPILIPMKKISQEYIDDAKKVVSDAKTALETTDLTDDIRPELYQRISSNKRNIEMAQRFLDQNYLYSSANYAFNARVIAGAIKEVAQTPELLSSDSTVLETKIASLRNEIVILKQKLNFVSINSFEWMVGAQQRLAYAENALNKLESNTSVETNKGTSDSSAAIKSVLFDRVYSYASAVAWVGVANDFLVQAKKINSKKTPVYSIDFVKTVDEKIIWVEALLSDSNAPDDILQESSRRLAAAKISRDNNFLFAALYDTYFAEAFLLSETNRRFYTTEQLFDFVTTDINSNSSSSSIWASMYLDHAKFFYENALFEKNQENKLKAAQSIETAYDMIYLSKHLTEAKNIAKEYLSNTKLPDYVDTEPVVAVNYTITKDNMQLATVLVIVIVVLLLVGVLLLGIAARARQNHLTFTDRKGKITTVLSNLDKALSSKRITDAEYFFMKKRYEEELSKNRTIAIQRKHSGMTSEDLRSKKRALERGLADLHRHFKSGLLVPEDYINNAKEVRNEIEEINSEVHQLLAQKRSVRAKQTTPSIFSKLKTSFFKPKDGIKGTEEQVSEEKTELSKEKSERRRLIRNFSYRKGRKKND
jgi:uncharacterized protein